jgi:hypothetical protein
LFHFSISSIKDGVFRQFRGSRESKEFLDFIEEKQWENIEPIAWWKTPSSLQMGVLGYFFKVSYVMKDYHKTLTEDYKYSPWVSYGLFTGFTILVGGALGLMAVLCLDCLSFSRRDQTEETDKVCLASHKLLLLVTKNYLIFRKKRRKMNNWLLLLLQLLFSTPSLLCAIVILINNV